MPAADSREPWHCKLEAARGGVGGIDGQRRRGDRFTKKKAGRGVRMEGGKEGGRDEVADLSLVTTEGAVGLRCSLGSSALSFFFSPLFLLFLSNSF